MQSQREHSQFFVDNKAESTYAQIPCLTCCVFVGWVKRSGPIKTLLLLNINIDVGSASLDPTYCVTSYFAKNWECSHLNCLCMTDTDIVQSTFLFTTLTDGHFRWIRFPPEWRVGQALNPPYTYILFFQQITTCKHTSLFS